MAAETLRPDGEFDDVGLVANDHLDHDEDPDVSSVTVNATGNNVDTAWGGDFPTPSGDPTVGADLQVFRVGVIEFDSGQTGVPTARIELWENGVLVRAGSNTNVSTYAVLNFTWNANELATADGSLVQCKLIGTKSGGSPSKRNTVRIGHMEWNVDFTAGPVTGVGDSAGTSTVTGDGVSTAAADGASTGAATATGDGVSTAAADGSAAGTSTVTGVASTNVVTGVGSSAGTSTVTGDGVSTAAADGSSAGVAVVAGTPAVAGASSGSSTAIGVGVATAAADGSSAGVATASAVSTETAEVAPSLGNLGWAPPQKASKRDRRRRREERKRREALRTEIVALFREAVEGPLPEDAAVRIATVLAPVGEPFLGGLPALDAIDFTALLASLEVAEAAVALLRQILAERQREEDELIAILLLAA